jgi:streptogramin lyase
MQQSQLATRRRVRPAISGLLLPLVLGAIGLSACGSSAARAPANPQLTNVPVTFTVRIPAGSTLAHARSPAYISTAIASVVFVLTAVAPTTGTYTGTLPGAPVIIALSYNAGNCTLVSTVETCTAAASAPAPATDIWTIYTYATTTPVVGTTTPLSIYAAFPKAITVAGPNSLTVATSGVPSTLVFSPATTSISGGVAQTLITGVQAVDAGGATLIGTNTFSDPAGVATTVNFTGCSPHFTPTPATFSATTPTVLGADPLSIAYDGLATGTGYCTAFAPSSLPPVITEYVPITSGSAPAYITLGSDGNLWFTEENANKIGRITTTGVVTEFPVPTASSQPHNIVAGPDGNLWFTEQTGNKVGKITTAGVVTEYSTGITASGQPYAITAGSDGNLWFTELVASKIGKITTSGVVTEYPTATGSSGPTRITPGTNSNLWFSELGANKIGVITTGGVALDYPLLTSGAQPLGIGGGPDGNIWFTESGVGKIGKITTAGVVTEYPVPSGSASIPSGIVTGPDGNVWFTEYGTNKIAESTTAGVVREYSIPTAGSLPYGIATGPHSDIWFCELGANKVGTLTLVGAVYQVNILGAGTIGGTFQ